MHFWSLVAVSWKDVTLVTLVTLFTHTHMQLFHFVQQLFQSIAINISEAGASNQPRDSTHTSTYFNVICTCGSH